MRRVQLHAGQSFERVQQFLDANSGAVGTANQTDAFTFFKRKISVI